MSQNVLFTAFHLKQADMQQKQVQDSHLFPMYRMCSNGFVEAAPTNHKADLDSRLASTGSCYPSLRIGFIDSTRLSANQTEALVEELSRVVARSNLDIEHAAEIWRMM